MMLAGTPVPDKLVLALAGTLRASGLNANAETLEAAYDAERAIVALTIVDREAILRALDNPPEGREELRGVLLAEHVGRKREGLV